MDKYNASLKQDLDPKGNDGYKAVTNPEKTHSELEITNKRKDLSPSEIGESIDAESEDSGETVGARTLEDIISSHEKFLPPGYPVDRTSSDRKDNKSKRHIP